MADLSAVALAKAEGRVGRFSQVHGPDSRPKFGGSTTPLLNPIQNGDIGDAGRAMREVVTTFGSLADDAQRFPAFCASAILYCYSQELSSSSKTFRCSENPSSRGILPDRKIRARQESRPTRYGCGLAVLCAMLRSALPAAGAEVDFLRDVRPILSGHCFKCHGPDEGARKGGLRLDLREPALKPAKSGEVAVIPGKPDKSELVRRVLTDDEDDLMPPPSTKLPLTDRQKEILKQWVAEGAEYKPHWAFVKPEPRPPPKVRDEDWPRNGIDYFVLARLEKDGFKPAARADNYALVRRVYLDLIGLPPTTEQADAFVNDPSPEAYERLVDVGRD